MGKQVGTFIRQLREDRGLSQGDVAKLLNLKTAQSISNIERGVSPLPKAKIKRLADVLGVKKADIVGVVLREVEERIAKAAGVQAKAGFGGKLSADESDLMSKVASRLQSLAGEKKSSFKKQLKKLLTA